MAQVTDQEYKNLKTQYEQLLEKHQNDSIKSRQKEHALQSQIQQLQTLITSLQSQLAEKPPLKPQQQQSNRVSELQSDVRRLIDQNILLTSQNTILKSDNSHLDSSNVELKGDIDQMKAYIKSLQKDMADLNNKQTIHVGSLTEEKLITGQEWSQVRQKNDKLMHSIQQLKQQLKKAEEQAQRAQDRERKAVQLLKKKQIELSALQSQINALKIPQRDKKKTEVSQTTCLKCLEHQQEIQLLKQMVKSTQGMVRVKEIENEKFRMHSEQVLTNQSRSSGKPKGTPLPPLSKKK